MCCAVYARGRQDDLLHMQSWLMVKSNHRSFPRFPEGRAWRLELVANTVRDLITIGRQQQPQEGTGQWLTKDTGLLQYLTGPNSSFPEVLAFTRELLDGQDVDINELIPEDIQHTRLRNEDSRQNWRLETPLMQAAAREWDEMVELLLLRGARNNKVGHCGMTAYGLAKAFKSEDIIRLIEQHTNNRDEGVKPSFRDWWNGENGFIPWPS
jgi:hypothetical protein